MINVFNKLLQREEDDLETQDMDLDNTNCSIEDSNEDENISQVNKKHVYNPNQYIN